MQSLLTSAAAHYREKKSGAAMEPVSLHWNYHARLGKWTLHIAERHVLVNCVAPGLLEGTRVTGNLPNAQIERSASGAILKLAADKDDCAEQVVTFCCADTNDRRDSGDRRGPVVSLARSEPAWSVAESWATGSGSP